MTKLVFLDSAVLIDLERGISILYDFQVRLGLHLLVDEDGVIQFFSDHHS